MSRALELGVNQNLHREALVSSMGEMGAAREGEWLEVPTTQGNQRKGLGRTGGGKKRSHCRAGRRPLRTPGLSDPRHTVSLLHTRTHTHTHARASFCTRGSGYRTQGKETAGEARGVGKALGASAGRAPPSPPPPRARARAHTRLRKTPAAARAPPTPTAPAFPGGMPCWLGSQLG